MICPLHDARAFSLSSFETLSSLLLPNKGFRLFNFLQSASWFWMTIKRRFSFVREYDVREDDPVMLDPAH